MQTWEQADAPRHLYPVLPCPVSSVRIYPVISALICDALMVEAATVVSLIARHGTVV